jgi:hypothetical protein
MHPAALLTRPLRTWPLRTWPLRTWLLSTWLLAKLTGRDEANDIATIMSRSRARVNSPMR